MDEPRYPIDAETVSACWTSSRRRFLRDLAVAGGGILGAGLCGCGGRHEEHPRPTATATPALTPRPTPAGSAPLKLHVTTCDHNCGGRCVLVVHVQGDRILRITTDDGRLTGRG